MRERQSLSPAGKLAGLFVLVTVVFDLGLMFVWSNRHSVLIRLAGGDPRAAANMALLLAKRRGRNQVAYFRALDQKAG